MGIEYTNSSLVDIVRLTKHKTNGRNNNKIDTITIHIIVGQWTAKKGVDYFATTDRKCSCNYVVGCDGSVGLCVEECNTSWCSSNTKNDRRAITIEVASDTKTPYKVRDKAYEKLILLVADICKRNGIEKLVWSDNSVYRVNHLNGCNMTVHKDFKNKDCPGTYLYNKHADIAERVNKILSEEQSFRVRVHKDIDLNIRAGAGMKYKINGVISGGGVFTIVKVDGHWGKLKSGAGWISILDDYVDRL